MPAGFPDFAEAEIESPQIGRWEIRAKLLALGKSDILLGQRADGEFAVIERFRPESLYGKHNGSAEILLQGDDPVKTEPGFYSECTTHLGIHGEQSHGQSAEDRLGTISR